MLGEIDKDFYCSTGYKRLYVAEEPRNCYGAENNACEGCPAKHRKHPTPEQFKEEYGDDVPDDMPVWVVCGGEKEDHIFWEVHQYGGIHHTEKHSGRKAIIVVACTPFPKPDNDWRPEGVAK